MNRCRSAQGSPSNWNMVLSTVTQIGVMLMPSSLEKVSGFLLEYVTDFQLSVHIFLSYYINVNVLYILI